MDNKVLNKELGPRIENKNLNISKDVSDIINALELFNKENEKNFKFSIETDDKDVKNPKQYGELFYNYLNTSWKYLKEHEEETNDISFSNNYVSLILSCLSSIRLISRDTQCVTTFECDELLNLLQQLGNLYLFNENISAQSSLELVETNSTTQKSNIPNIESINLNALKSISNLIYNSKYIQEYYARNGVAETICINLKLFSPSYIHSSSSTNIIIFNLRILFLLTVFNKDLRYKLREKLQVITYLIEIIDQIMKERLNNHENDDYCYLKLIDLDCLNEILKILYNLTIDIQSAKSSATNLLLGNRSGQLSIQNSGINNEEEEAHLMHLVSVLRDLVTCRLENNENGIHNEKINQLHSNIVNLLTNMPHICFEELMTPSLATSPQISNHESKSFKQINNYYSSYNHLNIRLAHNKKRMSRRSKRIKQNNIPKVKEEGEGNEDLTEVPTEEAYTPHRIEIKSSKYHKNHHVSNLDDEEFDFEGKNMEAVQVILVFMNNMVTNYLNGTSSSDQLLYPVLLLLSLMSKSNKIIRHYCCLKVLPQLTKIDLMNLPQSGNSIRNKLVRLMTDPNLHIKRLSAQFLFILCKENVARLIKYTGYGNAAGLLAEAGLMLSTHGDRGNYSSDDDSDSDTDVENDSEYKRLVKYINPITGRVELPSKEGKVDVFEGMTEEQKEYEAIKLVNAIDKLTRLGGPVKPATIGPDGRPVELEHVLQIQEIKHEYMNKNPNDDKSNNS